MNFLEGGESHLMKRLLAMNTRAISAIALMIGALSASGCASDLVMSSGPMPRAEDCAIIRQATPSQFVCGNGDYLATDGKTYTATQLADIRTGKAANK